MDMLSHVLGINGFQVIQINANDTAIHVWLERTANGGVCPQCGQSSGQVRSTYPRVIRDLPLSGKSCYLHVARRYFDCLTCQETFPEPLEFVEPKRNYTMRYEDAIFEQVRQTTATYVAAREGLTDQVITRIFLHQALQRLPKEPFKEVVRLGIDEIAERKGRQAYDLVFYNLDTGKPIDVLANRTQAELMQYFDRLPVQMTRSIEEVCIDMWRPYATAVTEKLPHARLVTDRFHVMKLVNQELKTLKNAVKNTLPEEAKACHYPLLKNEPALTEHQQEILEQVYDASPQLKEAHQLKEEFRELFDTDYTVQQGTQALQQWIDKAEKTQLFSETIKTVKHWFHSIVNYFIHRTTNGAAEGINNKIKVIKRMAYGFRNFAHFRLRILAAFL